MPSPSGSSSRRRRPVVCGSSPWIFRESVRRSDTLPAREDVMPASRMMTTRRVARALHGAVALLLAGCASDGGPATAFRPITGPGTCPVSPAALPAADVTVTLDPTQRFQTIQGFGTTQRLFDDPHTTETFDAVTRRATATPPAEEQARILDALYVDLGLTRVRFHPEGLETVNDNADPLSTDLSKF